MFDLFKTNFWREFKVSSVNETHVGIVLFKTKLKVDGRLFVQGA